MALRFITILLACFSFAALVTITTTTKTANTTQAQAIQSGTCGKTNVPIKTSATLYIMNGFEARPNSLPWMVSLRSGGGNCGGSLIRVNNKNESDIVVTAAHCVKNNFTGAIAVLGAHYMSKAIDGEEVAKADIWVMNPDYYQNSVGDLAIIKLSRPIKFSKTIQPICLPAQNESVPDGTIGIASGWGQTENGDPPELRQLRQVSLAKAVCNYFLCSKGSKSACFGDSGGPYFFENEQGYTMHGVMSSVSSCGQKNSTAFYTNVSNYVDWILETANALSDVK